MRRLVVLSTALLLACSASGSSDGSGDGSSSTGGGDGGGGVGAPFGPFTLSCAPNEARFAGTLGGNDYTFTAVARGCSSSGEVRCGAALDSDLKNIDSLIRIEHPGEDPLVSEEVTPARLWLLLPDGSSQANCATEAAASTYAYVGHGPKRFIATGLRTYDRSVPCELDDQNDLVCPVFDDVCSGAPVSGTVEACFWYQS